MQKVSSKIFLTEFFNGFWQENAWVHCSPTATILGKINDEFNDREKPNKADLKKILDKLNLTNKVDNYILLDKEFLVGFDFKSSKYNQKFKKYILSECKENYIIIDDHKIKSATILINGFPLKFETEDLQKELLEFGEIAAFDYTADGRMGWKLNSNNVRFKLLLNNNVEKENLPCFIKVNNYPLMLMVKGLPPVCCHCRIRNHKAKDCISVMNGKHKVNLEHSNDNRFNIDDSGLKDTGYQTKDTESSFSGQEIDENFIQQNKKILIDIEKSKPNGKIPDCIVSDSLQSLKTTQNTLKCASKVDINLGACNKESDRKSVASSKNNSSTTIDTSETQQVLLQQCINLKERNEVVDINPNSREYHVWLKGISSSLTLEYIQKQLKDYVFIIDFKVIKYDRFGRTFGNLMASLHIRLLSGVPLTSLPTTINYKNNKYILSIVGLPKVCSLCYQRGQHLSDCRQGDSDFD